MAVGFPTKVDYATGDVLSATNMNDLSGTVNLLESAQYAAGKNKIINGDFGVNQYGLNATGVAYSTGAVIDRWIPAISGATGVASLQPFTLGAAPVAGYEGTSFFRMATSVGNDFCRATTRIESVRTFANTTVTLSFWAKGTNPTTLGRLNVSLQQFFGTGGSPSSAVTSAEQNLVLTANWTRYSYTFVVPSISGKTLGTNNNDYLSVDIGQLANASTESWTLDLWGVQLEAGSTASPFQTATGTKQGELAACQRYYYRNTAPGTYAQLGGSGPASTTSIIYMAYNAPVPLRVTPTSVDYGGDLRAYDGVNYITVTSVATSGGINNNPTLQVNSAAGFTTLRPYFLSAQATGNAYIGFSAEL